MRPKATFKDGVRTELKSTYWGDDFTRPDDADLDPELAEIIVRWRGTFAQSRPSSQDTKQTLRKLRTLDDDHIAYAVKCIDPWTEAALWRLPDNPTPDQIRDEARRVLHTIETKDGRRAGRMDSVWFGIALANWWLKHKGRPTVTAANGYTTQESEFLTWGVKMFHRAGRAVGAEAVAKILREAITTMEQIDTLKNRME